MSFWSSLHFARAAPPPAVTVADIGKFARLIAESELKLDEGGVNFQAKYGDAIDVDDRPTETVEWDESGTVGTHLEYPWDRSDHYSSLSELASDLTTDRNGVYRAYLSLGDLPDNLVTALSRPTCEANEQPLCLHHLSFTAGPILAAALDSDAPAFVGWMGLSISGPGYFFPRTFREARERAESLEPIRRLAECCRSVWPVPPMSISEEAVENRRQMPEMWLYDEFDLPPDWYWFASEG